MAGKPIGPGTVLAGRFRLEDLLAEASGARFWRALDQILARSVAVHVIDADDPRGPALLVAARTSATVSDGHFLRVLDAAEEDGVVYVVNEWGAGVSLDRLLDEGPLQPRRAAWVVKEVAEAITTAHRQGIAHGRLLPENVMVTEAGSVKLIGFVIDAVLHGRPQLPAGTEPLSEHESDVLNLGALLYAGLVGKWPGTEGSSLPPAPREHGQPLRPRQVRAGVPRPLDAVCDRILSAEEHHHGPPIETAHEVCAALSDYIGDPTGSLGLGYEPTSVLDRSALFPEAAAVEDARPAQSGSPAGSQPAPQPTHEPTHEATPQAAAPDAGLDATMAAGPAVPPAARESPAARRDRPDPDATQAGAPVFADDDSAVGWISPSTARGLRGDETPARRTPPPELPEPEPRPLFAPEPAGRRRAAPEADTGQPWSTGATGGTGAGWSRPSHHTGPGTGSLPPVWGPDADSSDSGDREDRDERNAGKSWLRLGMVVGLCLMLLVAVVVAFNLGRGSGSSPDVPAADTSPGSTPSAVHRPVRIAAVSDFDPQGDPAEENPELAPLAVDGNPGTAWRTMTYYGNPQLGGLKEGVGLRLDLGKVTSVSDVRVRLVGSPTSLQLLAASPGSSAPTSTDGLKRVAAVTGAGTEADLRVRGSVRTRYLVVWLTSLPPASGGYAGQVAEISVTS